MGIYAVENMLVYIIVPFCIYLIYLYYNPVLKRCQFCETDGYFHRCLPNTGSTGEWCKQFNQADDMLLSLGKQGITLLRHLIETVIFIPTFQIRSAPVVAELLYKIRTFRFGKKIRLALLRLGNPFPQCKVKISVLHVAVCWTMEKQAKKVEKIINKGVKKMFSKIANTIYNQIAKGMKKIFYVIFKSVNHLFRLVKVLFTTIINGLKQIIGRIQDIFQLISELQIMSVFRGLFIIVLGILAPGVMASYLVAMSGFLIIFAIPLGGIIGGTHLFLYSLLMCINLAYQVFDIDVRDSSLVRMLEAIV